MRNFAAICIVANGEFPTHPVPLAVLREASFVVACDGAVTRVPQADVVIGDGDSVPAAFRDRLVQIDEQEDNDLTKAVRYLLHSHLSSLHSRLSTLGSRLSNDSRLSAMDSRLSNNPIRYSRPSPLGEGSGVRLSVAFLACTGKRIDHSLGNISLLMRYYRDMQVQGTMYTNEGFFTPAHGTRTFPSFPGQQVSIFNFGSTRIQSEGLRWASYAYQEWWQGTLNEALTDTITIQADGYYLLFQTYEKK